MYLDATLVLLALVTWGASVILTWIVCRYVQPTEAETGASYYNEGYDTGWHQGFTYGRRTCNQCTCARAAGNATSAAFQSPIDRY
jgi:hypothetical protein